MLSSQIILLVWTNILGITWAFHPLYVILLSFGKLLVLSLYRHQFSLSSYYRGCKLILTHIIGALKL
jgi:hypothetical protein